ncbi:hypothetical protein [Clostridium sp.]
MTAKTNVYEMVTDRIIAELEKGIVPWKRLGRESEQRHTTELQRNLTALSIRFF